jgi:hypothetical protein
MHTDLLSLYQKSIYKDEWYVLFLKDCSCFKKKYLYVIKAYKKISLNFEFGARVKLIFENHEFSCFSMGVRISKIHNSKTMRDKKFLIFTSN